MKKIEILLQDFLKILVTLIVFLLFIVFFYSLYLGLNDKSLFSNNSEVKSQPFEDIILGKILQKVEDKNHTYHKISALAIARFIEKYSKNKESIDLQKAREYVKELSNQYEEDKFISLFAKEYSNSIEKVLQNPKIIELTISDDPYSIIEKVTDTFIKEFDKKYVYPNQNDLFAILGIQREPIPYLSLSVKALEYIIILLSFLLLLKIHEKIDKID